MTPEALKALLATAETDHAAHCAAPLGLDLTRGKPAADQLSFANGLDGILQGQFLDRDGSDTRNYGGPLGIPELRDLGAAVLEVPAAQVLAGGNSSLTLMYQFVDAALRFGFGAQAPWGDGAKMLCPVPGYDRHFAIGEHLGLELVPVPMTDSGPCMDAVEAALAADPSIKALWVVPKYSNPTGVSVSEAVTTRLAALPTIAGPGFQVLWDNAYAVHDLTDTPTPLPSLWSAAEAAGTLDHMALFASTSKMSWAGGGVAFFAAGPNTFKAFNHHLSFQLIGPDKVNQLRHARLFPDLPQLRAHMAQHRALLKPKFDAVLSALDAGLGNTGLARWTVPEGGYFISVDVVPGTAKTVVALAAEAGVKLTPAGATHPYGKDPDDQTLRLAPSFPPLADVEAAMAVFVNCVRLAGARQRLKERPE